MLVSKIKGLKFPDDYMIKAFFKESLHKKSGSVLEFGCANGNNLSLFYQFGWNVVGVDLSKNAIDDANFNFFALKKENSLQNDFEFVKEEMISWLENVENREFDAIIFPNIIEYLTEKEIEKVFLIIAKKRLLKKSGFLFFRTRTPNDFRYARGERINDKSFKISIDETSEEGLLLTFLSEYDLMKLIEKYFVFKDFKTMRCSFDNYQNGLKISNDDIIVWGFVEDFNL